MKRSFSHFSWLGLLVFSLLDASPADAQNTLSALSLTDSVDTRTPERDAEVNGLLTESAQRLALDALLEKALHSQVVPLAPRSGLGLGSQESLALPAPEIGEALKSLARELGHGPLQRQLTFRLQGVEAQLRALTQEQARQAGRSMPRKRDLGVEGLQAPPYTPPSERLQQAIASRQVWQQLLLALGEDAALVAQPAVAFRCFASVLRADADQWKRWPEARRTAFLDGAVFLITTARLAEEVHAFYEHSALDRSELVKRTVARIERWLELYTKAPDSLTDFSGGRQTLTDMLYILGDDAAAATFIPEKERRRLLSRLAEAARARGHYAETIGAYARLGDVEALSALGRKLSNPLVQDLGHMLVVRREFGSAIEAFSVAEEKGSLHRLLLACQQTAKGLEHETRPVRNSELLPVWIQQLTALLADGPVATAFLKEVGKGSDARAQAPASAEEEVASLEDARLGELIDLYSRDLKTLSDGATRARQALEKLEQEALRRNQYGLALRAASRPGNSASLRLLGEHFAQTKQYALALEAYRHVGSEASAELKALGDRMLSGRGLLSHGNLEPMIPLAVEAYILADAIEPLEAMLPGLRGLQAELSRQADGETRGASLLRQTLQRISDAYELEPAPAPKPTRTAASNDERSSR